jgi:hypothetical protein
MDSERDLSEVAQDLRATSEDIAADAAELGALEKRKAKLAPEDPRIVPLSEAAEELAERIAAKTTSETALAKDAASAG